MKTAHMDKCKENGKVGRTRAAVGSFVKSLAPDITRARNEGDPRARAGLRDVGHRLASLGLTGPE